MSPFYKRLHVNIAILSIQSGGNQLMARISINNNLHFQKAYTVVIDKLVNKDLKQVDFKIHCSGNGGESGGGSSVK